MLLGFFPVRLPSALDFFASALPAYTKSSTGGHHHNHANCLSEIDSVALLNMFSITVLWTQQTDEFGGSVLPNLSVRSTDLWSRWLLPPMTHSSSE